MIHPQVGHVSLSSSEEEPEEDPGEAAENAAAGAALQSRRPQPDSTGIYYLFRY